MSTPAEILGVTQAKLETFIDSKDLAKLTDTRHRGTPWTELVAEQIEFACALVLSVAEVQVQMLSLLGRTDLVLFGGWAVRKAAIGCWEARALGPLPENLQRLSDQYEAWADKYTERRRTPALDPEANPQHPLQVVDFDPEGVKVTRDTMKGFW